MKELHVVFGTGPLALAVMRRLRRADKRVRLLNRSGWAGFDKDLDTEVGGIDASDPTQAREVCEGAACVYHCIGLPYTEWDRFPAIATGIIEGAAAAGAPLVYADNLYMYGPVSGPMHEDLPPVAQTRKGRIRAQVAEQILRAHKAGTIRASIGRGSDFFGPYATANAMMGSRVFGAAVSGKIAKVVGNPDCLHSYTYLEDFANALVILGAAGEAMGKIWHVPTTPPTLTTRGFVERVYHAAGRKPKLMAAGRAMVTLLGVFDAQARELKEMLYQFERDFVLDSSRFERTFNVSPTPFSESIPDTLAWFRSQPADRPTRFRRR